MGINFRGTGSIRENRENLYPRNIPAIRYQWWAPVYMSVTAINGEPQCTCQLQLSMVSPSVHVYLSVCTVQCHYITVSISGWPADDMWLHTMIVMHSQTRAWLMLTLWAFVLFVWSSLSPRPQSLVSSGRVVAPPSQTLTCRESRVIYVYGRVFWRMVFISSCTKIIRGVQCIPYYEYCTRIKDKRISTCKYITHIYK